MTTNISALRQEGLTIVENSEFHQNTQIGNFKDFEQTGFYYDDVQQEDYSQQFIESLNF